MLVSVHVFIMLQEEGDVCFTGELRLINCIVKKPVVFLSNIGVQIVNASNKTILFMGGM